MVCPKYEPNIWLRVALDIEGAIDEGAKFVYCGYVFTALSEDLAISNNVLGCVKYVDEELILFVTDEGKGTIGAVISTLIHVENASYLNDHDPEESEI